MEFRKRNFLRILINIVISAAQFERFNVLEPVFEQHATPIDLTEFVEPATLVEADCSYGSGERVDNPEVYDFSVRTESDESRQHDDELADVS